MPKQHTLPTLYDDCKTISISKLKEWGYLDGSIKSGSITWSRNGEQYASISILVNTFYDIPFVELSYTCNGEPIKYKINLVLKLSNLRKGHIWYFLCPNTKKRCRKLYMVQTYFLHRDAFNGAMYEKQTYSKNARHQIQALARLFGSDEAYVQMRKKYFKKTYAGKPTKRYLRLMAKL